MSDLTERLESLVQAYRGLILIAKVETTPTLQAIVKRLNEEANTVVGEAFLEGNKDHQSLAKVVVAASREIRTFLDIAGSPNVNR